mgnify:CR=1 FL=1
MNEVSLKSLIEPLHFDDATYSQYAIATTTNHFVRVFVPHSPQRKLIPGMELSSKRKASKLGIQTEDDLKRALRRAKQNVRDICFSNTFDLFGTFTFAKDRSNDDKLTQRMIDWLKNQKKKWGNFDYIIVKERQKDGTLHFHALMSGFKGKLKAAINPKTGKNIYEKGRKVYNFSGYKSGFTTCVKIDRGIQSQEKVISYLVKYLTKEKASFKGKKRYWTSRSLKRPKIEVNPDDWYEELDPVYSHVNEYGKTLICTVESVDRVKA